MPPPSLKPRIEVLEKEIAQLKKDLEALKLRPEIALAGMLKPVEPKPVELTVSKVSDSKPDESQQGAYTPPANIPQAIPNSTLSSQPTPMPEGKPKERSMGCMVFEPAQS